MVTIKKVGENDPSVVIRKAKERKEQKQEAQQPTKENFNQKGFKVPGVTKVDPKKPSEIIPGNGKNFFSREKVAETINKAKSNGDNPKTVLEGLVSKGYILEGFNDVQRQQVRKKAEKKGGVLGFFRNIVGSTLESVTGLPKFVGGVASRGLESVGAINPETGQRFRNFLDEGQDIGQDRSAIESRIVKGVADIAQLAAPGGVGRLGAKAGKLAGKIAGQGSKLGRIASKGASGLARGTTDVVAGQAIAEGEMASATDVGIGLALGGLTNQLFRGISALGNVKGIAEDMYAKAIKLTPTQIKKFRLPNVAGVKPERRLLDKKVSGSLEQINKKLGKIAEKSYKTLNSNVKKVDGTFESQPADELLAELQDQFAKTRGNEKLVNKITDLLQKPEKSLSELLTVKRLVDRNSNLWKATGDPATEASKQGLLNLRQRLQKQIQNIGENKGVTNIKELSKDIQLSKNLEGAIENTINRASKNESFGLRDLLTAGAVAPIAAAGTDPLTSLAWSAGVVGAKKALESPTTRTTLAQILDEFPGAENAATKFIRSANKKLSAKDKRELKRRFDFAIRRETLGQN